MAEALRTRAQEVAEIYEACSKYGLQARAKGFVDSGATLIEVRSQILDLRTTPGSPTQPPSEQLVPLAPKDARRYSVLRAIRSLVDQREGRISKIEGIEGEVHAELAKLAAEGGVQNRGGLFLPMRLFEGPMDREMRAVTMSPSSAGLGAELVQQSRGELIDILRNRTCLVSPLGARILPGLVGNITWPRVKNEPTVQWMGVNPATGASDSAMGYGWVTSTPKTMIGTVPFPRQLINATGIDVENDVRNRLGIGHGLALDLAGIVGKGTDKEPLGILNNPDVQTYDIGTSGTPAVPTFAKLKRMTGLVSKKNVVGGQLGWLTTALMASELGATLKAAAVPGFIWEGNNEDGTMAGYKAAASGQVPENLYTSTTDHGLVFGAWDNIIFGLWGALEVIIDNVSMATQGQIRVTTFQQGDTVNQRPEAFVLGRYAKISA